MITSLLNTSGAGVLRVMKTKVTASRLSLVSVLIFAVLIVGPQISEANLKVIITIDGGWRYVTIVMSCLVMSCLVMSCLVMS